MDDPKLTIRLLGSIEIKNGDEVININRRIERFILYILSVEHQPVSRTTLIDMLWPEAEQKDPRGALRTALSRLRRELPDPELIITELDSIKIDLNRCTNDIVRFEDFYHSLQKLLAVYQNNQSLPAQIVSQVQKALDLWHGEKILQGENLTSYPAIEIWQQSHNNRLIHQRKFLIRRLAEHFKTAGKLELALEQYQVLGKLDVLDIPIHLSILDILTQLGRHNDALDYCDLLEKTYEKEFNAPLPDSILKRCQFLETKITEKNDTKNDWRFPLTMQLPLVGRQKELNQLKQAFFNGGIFILRGELGVGKTRLVQELLQSLGRNQGLFLTSGRETEYSLPFSPLIHGLRQWVSQDIWQELESSWIDQLHLLLPELVEIRSDIQDFDVTHYPTGKQNLFDALSRLFQIMKAKVGRLLFFLDDGQWVDTQTIQALAYLISQGLFNSDGLLLIALRPEEPNKALEEMFDRFYRTHPINFINLNNLNPEELRFLVESAMGKKAATEFIARLFSETKGNPFITLEIVRDILDKDQGIELLEDIPSLPLPESIRSIIQKRFNQFDDLSRHILLCAAVLGNSIPPDLLKSVSTFTQALDIDYLDPLVKSGFINILNEEDPSRLSFQFAHEKIREVILKGATPSSLRILHKRVADHMIELNNRQELSGSIANHFLASGDILSAYLWFIKTAQHAWTLGAKEDALNAYLQAEKLFRDAAEGFFTIEDILDLYDSWSDFAYESDQSELLEQVGLKLQFLGEREKNPRLLGYSFIALANSCFLRMEMDTGRDLIEKAIENLRITTDHKALAQAILRHSAFCWWQWEFDCAQKGAEQVLELCASYNPVDDDIIGLQFYAMHVISMTYYAKGDANKALHNAEETYKHYFHLINPFDRLRTLHMLAAAHELAGDFSSCMRYIEEGLEIAQAIENTFIEEILLTIRAKAQVIQGHLDEAYQSATNALAIGEKYGRNHTIIDANCILGRIFFTLQNKAEALQHYRLAQIRDGFPPRSMHGIENSIQIGRILNMEGKIPEARELIAESLTFSQEKGLQAHFSRARIVDAYCDMLEGKTNLAKEKFTEAYTIAEKLGLKYEEIWSKKGLAHLAIYQKQYEEANQLLLETLDETQKLNFVWLHLNAWTHYIELMELTGQFEISEENRSKFKTVIQELEKHSRSEPLRKAFESAEEMWIKKGILIT